MVFNNDAISKYMYDMLECIVLHVLQKEKGVDITKIISECYKK